MAACIHRRFAAVTRNSSMKQLVQSPVKSSDRQHKAAQSADHAYGAAHRPDMVRIIDRDMPV
jgi:hypothetical protein